VKEKAKIEGHTKAVLDLSWNQINRNILASASADKSIILWDLDVLKQATKIKKQTSKIQSIKFHPIESFSLLSGSLDQTVALYDCRNPNMNFKTWDFQNGEIERVLWNHLSPNYFLVCSKTERVYMPLLFYFFFSTFEGQHRPGLRLRRRHKARKAVVVTQSARFGSHRIGIEF
jgi:periodic tryptophan protein 1